MEQIIYIYNKDLEIIAQPYITNLEEFKESPTKFYPDWDNTMYATLEKYNNPILDNAVIREKTREELILLDNKIELLEEGEIIENGEIRKIKKPEGYKMEWQSPNWVETITKEELTELRKDKILEYSKLEEDKKLLESSKFSTLEEIELIVEKMKILEGEINNIATASISAGGQE
ncbi:hypothetical protein DW261_03550 [Fusobacterium varium]|uniref:hypothetical protein n=1 Tax=Fusobacterium varium TaxID=856 RepID=UPI000E4776CC|nr:hypothetical protein [Fusobacterium varium]RHG37481.1 hypothetical protein DW261_03550 [Fusobacterium varium]